MFLRRFFPARHKNLLFTDGAPAQGSALRRNAFIWVCARKTGAGAPSVHDGEFPGDSESVIVHQELNEIDTGRYAGVPGERREKLRNLGKKKPALNIENTDLDVVISAFDQNGHAASCPDRVRPGE